MWGLHLNFLQLEITFLLMHALRATRRKRGGGAKPQKVKCLLAIALGRLLQPPWRGSATSACPSLSSRESWVINY